MLPAVPIGPGLPIVTGSAGSTRSSTYPRLQGTAKAAHCGGFVRRLVPGESESGVPVAWACHKASSAFGFDPTPQTCLFRMGADSNGSKPGDAIVDAMAAAEPDGFLPPSNVSVGGQGAMPGNRMPPQKALKFVGSQKLVPCLDLRMIMAWIKICSVSR